MPPPLRWAEPARHGHDQSPGDAAVPAGQRRSGLHDAVGFAAAAPVCDGDDDVAVAFSGFPQEAGDDAGSGWTAAVAAVGSEIGRTASVGVGHR